MYATPRWAAGGAGGQRDTSGTSSAVGSMSSTPERTGEGAPPMRSLIGRIVDQTRKQPDEPALIWCGEVTTYRRLAAMMHAAPAQLDSLGPGAVGIFARKSAAAVGLVLGCLAAGRRVVIPSSALPSETLGTLFD